jgi:Coenzyme PQQ synthesis protein D (PqqD)
LNRFRKVAAVSDAPSGEALVVVNLDQGVAFRLNGTARLMWALAVEGHTAEEIAAALAGRLLAPPERLRTDAEALLRELTAAALLEPIGERP